MTVDLGDVYPLTVAITDTSGQLANAGSVALTITLPDGSIVSVGPVTPTSTGIYDYDYPTVQAGRHTARWVATGANASAFRDVFVVDPAEGEAFIGLVDAKDHMRKKDATVDDEKLRGFIDAGCDLISDRMGHVSPMTTTSDLTVRSGTVVLPERPVIEIVSVVQLPGGTAIPPADPVAATKGWTLTSKEGVLTITGYCGDARVLYRVGRSPLPPRFRLAGLELIWNLWRASQQNASGGRPAVSVEEVIVPGTTFALPYSVRQLLGLDKRPRDEVQVG